VIRIEGISKDIKLFIERSCENKADNTYKTSRLNPGYGLHEVEGMSDSTRKLTKLKDWFLNGIGPLV